LHWSFPDPSALVGSRENKVVEVRKIRDEIRDKVRAWCEEMACSGDR
jgi:arsenate reductase (thioredoxin)